MGTSGHTHDGTSAEGGPVTVLGPVQDFVASATEIKPKTTNTLDIGTSGLLFKDMFLDGVATVGSIKIDNAGTIGSASDADAITISSGGVVTFSQAVSNLGNVTGKTSSGFVLALQTSDTTIEATNVLGKIEFSAPDEASGTDAILVGASIEALAEDTFDSSTNSTALVFKTNTTGAATERMRLTSAGDLHFLDNRKAIFGAGSDLQIYHDGHSSWINEEGSGSLLIAAEDFYLRSPLSTAEEYMIRAIKDEGVDLYYNNSKKLATTNTGVDITGTLTSDGLTAIAASANTDIAIFDGATGNGTRGLKISTEADNAADQVVVMSAQYDGAVDGYFKFKTADLERLRIDKQGDISFYEDTGTTAKFFWDASAESLGIGTSSPARTLHLNGSDSDTVQLHITNATTGSTSNDGFSIALGSDESGILNMREANPIRFFTSDTERMRIDSSGMLGLGSTPPTDAHATWSQFFIGEKGSVISEKSGSGGLYGLWLTDNSYVDNDTGSFSYRTTDEASSINLEAGNTVFRYAASGTAGAALTWSESMRIDSSGNVGIGTTSPTADGLQIVEATQSDFFMGNTADPDGFRITYNSTDTSIGTYSNTPLRIRTNGSERMRIDSSGNVGIGLSSGIDGKLHVGGNTVIGSGSTTAFSSFTTGGLDVAVGSGTKAFQVWDDNSTSTPRFIVERSGNVGIGTSSIAAKVHIESASASITPSVHADELLIEGSGNSGITVGSGTSSEGSLRFADSGGDSRGQVNYSHSSDSLRFYTADSLAATIDSSGNLLVGTTSTGAASGGSGTSGININASGAIEVARSGNPVMFVNRTTSDGDIMQFRKDGSTVGSIGIQSGNDLYLLGDDGGLRFQMDSDFIQPCSSSGSDDDNRISLGQVNSRFKDLYLSGGVYLGGTGSANKLDEYEEGTFQANFSAPTSGTITIQSTADTLAYTKVGRLVTITGMVSVVSTGSAVGDFVLLNNLPFTSADLSEFAGRNGGAVTYNDNSAGTKTSIGTIMLESSTQIRLYVDASSIGGSDDFYVSFSYTTT